MIRKNTLRNKILESRISRLEKLFINENSHGGQYNSNKDLLDELGLDYSKPAYEQADYVLDHISSFFRSYLVHDYFSDESDYLEWLNIKSKEGLTSGETSDFASKLPDSFGKVSRSKRLWKSLTSLAAEREIEQFTDAVNNGWVEFVNGRCIVTDTRKYPLFDRDIRWNTKKQSFM